MVTAARSQNPLRNWQVDRASIRTIGQDLQRPECILAERDGTLWSADARGGVMRIAPDGTQTLIAQQPDTTFTNANDTEKYILRGTLPNGLAFAPDGNILIANFGTNAIESMSRDGRSKTLYTEVDGRPLGKTNFVMRDSKHRLWVTVTTRLEPWTRSVTERTNDGYVALIDEKGIRIVAEGFVGTNEVRLDAKEEWLYVVESNARRISRLRLQPDGSLTDREIYGPSDLGGVPDGFAFDSFGNLWVTLVMYDRLIAITPEGEVLTLLDDGVPEQVAALDRNYYARTLTPELMLASKGTIAPWMASLTFGGPDLRTVYLGSLMGTTIPYFRSPVAGLPMVHWSETY
ncbi:SMP-30/gluconolactonase/LRE family protein [Steroidobacter sp.]|uniref:SMP-30/gluconolactonase/LRE family protein n=1 Tax=Steroidobacter sp. TaxID=1978227 RepID=UPI001A58A624|nr:SMP-30/gluconolactonase/LRE family protein [Steroidobacter sp.]MBL8265096.1 SMP-30/gluconolactonase/LRE family protein [Steroidobacter sp.]